MVSFGPSEILTLADDSGCPEFIAARHDPRKPEHDPGSCFLLDDVGVTRVRCCFRIGAAGAVAEAR